MSKAPTIEAIIRGPKFFRRGLFTMSEMMVGDPCGLVREPENPYDTNAVYVTNDKERPFGYIQREKVAELAKWMDAGWVYTCVVIKAPHVKRVNGFIGVKTDDMLVRCIPIQPISQKKEVNLSELFGLDKVKELETT